MITAGHQCPQGTAVPVLHPTVRADKAQRPPFLQQVKRALDEGDIEVGPIINGDISAAVFRHEVVRDQLLSHVGWIAHNKIELGSEAGQKEISGNYPALRQQLGIALAYACQN